ncbi:hypothetical protein IJG14_03185 [bacterium]|nr:hypothetical protein [bacterium]
MILKEFSQYLLENEDISSVKLLYKWLKEKLEVLPVSNVDKIIKEELYTAENEYGDFLIIAKRESGRNLLKALYNFALSFEHQKVARDIHKSKPSDFNN